MNIAWEYNLLKKINDIFKFEAVNSEKKSVADYEEFYNLGLLEKYQNRIDFNYNRFQVNYGSFSLVKQWNRCLEMINDEEWVMFLGDDDVLQNNVVSEFYRNLNESNSQVDVVRFSTCKIDALGLITSPNFTHPKLENSADFLFRNVRSSLSEYVFRKNKVK